MKLDGILPFCRKLLSLAVSEGDIAVDATAGKGNDTLFLAKLIGDNGHVYSFDIQKEAIDATREKLVLNKLDHKVTLIQTGHENAAEVIQKAHAGRVAAAVFNLGYLPGSDKSVVTKPNTTIQAIRELFRLMKPAGMIVLVVYHGHTEGQAEKEELLSYVQELDQTKAHVMQYGFINQKNNPPFIIAIEKRG
ncbi:class I SAM-dependent methyltransferase [Metabacillus sp. RGM 3146]|uniref:class I SAM-dependent methyltransferase n=1 Tax=Metabacillus sp. RGM 3146 TaxID=3401092 RepID=UPI003B999D91